MNVALLPRMDDYTWQAKAYWWTMALLGLAVLGIAVAGVGSHKAGAVVQVLLGTLFAATTGLFPVRVPGAKTSGSAAEIFVFLLLLDFGPGAAAIAAAAAGGVIFSRTSPR